MFGFPSQIWQAGDSIFGDKTLNLLFGRVVCQQCSENYIWEVYAKSRPLLQDSDCRLFCDKISDMKKTKQKWDDTVSNPVYLEWLLQKKPDALPAILKNANPTQTGVFEMSYPDMLQVFKIVSRKSFPESVHVKWLEALIHSDLDLSQTQIFCIFDLFEATFMIVFVRLFLKEHGEKIYDQVHDYFKKLIEENAKRRAMPKRKRSRTDTPPNMDVVESDSIEDEANYCVETVSEREFVKRSFGIENDHELNKIALEQKRLHLVKIFLSGDSAMTEFKKSYHTISSFSHDYHGYDALAVIDSVEHIHGILHVHFYLEFCVDPSKHVDANVLKKVKDKYFQKKKMRRCTNTNWEKG